MIWKYLKEMVGIFLTGRRVNKWVNKGVTSELGLLLLHVRS